MTYPSTPLKTVPVYRPKRIPRVIRRQLPVVQICLFVALSGALVAAVSWRNVYHDRLTLDVGMQAVRMDSLKKEIRQVRGMIEREASFPRISRWARDKNGWKTTNGSTAVLVIPESLLTEAAKQEWKLWGQTDE